MEMSKSTVCVNTDVNTMSTQPDTAACVRTTDNGQRPVHFPHPRDPTLRMPSAHFFLDQDKPRRKHSALAESWAAFRRRSVC